MVHALRRALFAALFSLLALGIAGCAEFQNALSTLEQGNDGGLAQPPIPPRVTVAEVRLAEAPSNPSLVAYFCAQVAPALVCQLIAPVPAREQLRFAFDVDLDIANDNQIPLPMVEVLAAFTAFPAATGQQNLGAVCVQLCQDPTTCPQDAARGCRTTGRDIRTMDDFARASVNFLVAVAEGRERFENLRIRTVAPNAHTRATLRLRLDADVVLSLLNTLAQDAVSTAQQGRQVQFAIPYRFEGTVWVDVEHFGRIGVAVPAFEGRWVIPTEGLVPRTN